MLVRGELDLDSEHPLVEAAAGVLRAAPGCTLLVDLSGLTFIDSSGIRALMRMHQAHGARVRLGDVSEPVMRLLDITGLGDRLCGGDGSEER